MNFSLISYIANVNDIERLYEHENKKKIQSPRIYLNILGYKQNNLLVLLAFAFLF